MAPRTPKPRAPKLDDAETLQVEGPTGPIAVRVSSPGKLYFSRQVQLTKLDIVRYFLAVAPGALRGIRNRPIVLKRFVNGAEQEPFYQKRAPTDLPAWMRTVTLSFPSGRTAEEVVVDHAPGLAWIVNLGCMELHPHPVTADNLQHPDELRVDLDPGPGVGWEDVREVAMIAKAVLEDHGLTAWAKTSGSRGMHVNARIEPRWSFTEVRRAALALAREVERRVPALASSKWWKEERHGVFLDYNQNAKDRTTAAAYSVRPLPDARVSAPLRWDEVLTCNPADFTVLTMPARFAALGDPHAQMDAPEHTGSLDALLELAARDEASGLGDAPWPPHFAKAAGEPKRVQPSKAKSAASAPDHEHLAGMEADEPASSPHPGSSSGLQPANASAPPGHPASAPVPGGLPAPATPFSEQLNEGFGAHRFRKQSKRVKVTAGAQASSAGQNSQEESVRSDTADTAQASEAAETQQHPAGQDPVGRGFSPDISGPAQQGASAPEVLPGKDPVGKQKGRRASKFPLVVVAQSPDRAAADAGLDRWRAAHPEAAAHLAVDDILVDRMRGSAYVWYRIRVNLRHVPEDQRPAQATPDPDDDPTRAWREAAKPESA